LSTTEYNPLSDSLAYRAYLPLEWRSQNGQISDGEHLRTNEKNEHVLRWVNLLGEQVREVVEEEGDIDSRLIRLETKVNLILDLISTLVQREIQHPEMVNILLAAKGMEWISQATPPELGRRIWVSLSIDQRIPEALKLSAKVVDLAQEDGAFRVRVRFDSMGEMVLDLLEKMIFRYHRRQIAQSRP